MKIAIFGTRGIPNNHGGFEQFAEYLALGLVREGEEVTVYNSHNHPYKETNLNGVKIVHCYDPEEKIGTAGQFIYDFNCIVDLRKREFDIILQLGYTSSSIWGFLVPPKSILTTNMDGLEWKRSKYSTFVQKFLKFAEKLAVKHSDYLIADSIGIQQYLKGKYQKPSTFIPYGANIFRTPNQDVIESFEVDSFDYNLLIARLEPENNVETILTGITRTNSHKPFLVIGKYETKYGHYLKQKFLGFENIKFLGGIYDQNKLNNLRFYSNIYFHGHTVGGTNPSLLEAMASSALICAHDNIFNRSILGEDAYYFQSSDDITKLVNYYNGGPVLIERQNDSFINNNLKKIEEHYSWPLIINQYINHFQFILKTRNASFKSNCLAG